ncbi:MAG: DUF4124 domain-containing protein [Alteromonadaceae bacterium]|nr:DUF4124 domain-containing protein [Alteromonadaceae bacterium]
MKYLLTTTALALWATTAIAGSVYKCTDPATGAVSFTDAPCRDTSQAEQVDIQRGNTVSSRQVYRDLQRLEAEQAAERRAEEARRRDQQRRMQELQQYQASRRAQEERDDICSRITRPLKGAQNGQLTASQRDAMMHCAGISVPDRDYSSTQPSSAPTPPTPPAPTNITSCDEGGCWDNQGGRYNRGAGSTYIHQGGSACQMIGGQMHCP